MRSFVLFAALMLAVCESRVEIDHPFYLIGDSELEPGLYRCPNGSSGGCAIDGLPGPTIVQAGADKRFVVVAQEPPTGPTSYYYFARVPEETRGWGKNPEKIVGPLNVQEFTQAKMRLRLPDFTVNR